VGRIAWGLSRPCIEVYVSITMKHPNKRARRKGDPKRLTSAAVSRKTPRSAAQYNALPDRSKDTLERALKVITKMRGEKLSLKKAALEAGVKPETVKRWAGSALTKRANGRYATKKSDQLLRVLKIPSADGTRDIPVRGSRQATLLAEFWNAAHHYLETGDASRLEKFKGKSIKTADGTEIPLPTDRAELNRLGSAGVLSFESLYSRSA
jgi:hypothetical protein